MTDGKLKSYVERIAKLAEERKAIGGDIADVLQEAKSSGYIPKTLRKVVARYMADPAKLAEDDALLETYEAALGRLRPALEAIRAGATVDVASKATGVPRATVARASAVSNRREMITPDGVIHETPGATETPGAASPGTAACHPPSPGSPPPESTGQLEATGGAHPPFDGSTGGRHVDHQDDSPVEISAAHDGGVTDDCESPAAGEKAAHTSGDSHDGELTAEPEVARVAPPVTSRPSMQPVIIPDDVALERMEEARANWESKRRAIQ